MLVVYTAIFGGYDHLKQPRVISPETNYYVLTNLTLLSPPHPWRAKIVDSNWDCPRSPIKAARWCKTHPELLFPRADGTVWIDGNIRLLTSIDELTRRALWQDLDNHLDMGLFAHPHRSCVYTEASACISLNKDDPDIIRAHMARYREEGYPANAGLVATGVLVRKPTDQIKAFNKAWWYEIEGGSVRDQLSFNYVVRRLGVPYGIIPGSIFNSPFVCVEPHAN